MDPRFQDLDETEQLILLIKERQELDAALSHTVQDMMIEVNRYAEMARLRHEHQNREIHKRQYKKRQRKEGEKILEEQYFADYRPTFGDKEFRRRFMMQRHLFLKILEQIQSVNIYFVQRLDACKVPGLSGRQKMTCALRMMAYNMPADATDEYIRIGTTTAIETMKEFCRTIIHRYGDEYLRRPNAADVQRLLDDNAQRGFPGMLGSIDCMHWEWRNCPTAWQGQYVGQTGSKPTVILEAVADKHGWFWYAHFGMPGSLNDLNCFHGTDLFNNLLNGTAPPCNYTMNGHEYNMGYYLGDGIYPKIASIVKAIRKPQPGTPEAKFTKQQESVRKDVEMAFGMLQARFSYIREPCRYLQPEVLTHIMKAAIILNNMIVEDERFNTRLKSPLTFENPDPLQSNEIRHEQLINVPDIYARVYSRPIHDQLTADLVAHIWENVP